MTRIMPIVLLLLPSIPATAASPFDGVYAGQRTVVRGAPPTCPKEGPARWDIIDGKTGYKIWAGTIPVQVGSDGSVKGDLPYRLGGAHGGLEHATVDGMISGGSLEANVGWYACDLHFSLKKK